MRREGTTYIRSMIETSRRKALGLVLIGAVLSLPQPAVGQTILGRVLDQVNEQPIGGAIVSLVTRSGEERVRALADSVGRFVITPPEAGEYVLVAARFGYYETRSPLIALGTEGEAPLEMMMSPQPLGIDGLEVSVEELAAEELNQLGLTPRQLGNRWIDREEIDAIPVKRDMGVILERTAQAGIRITRPENLVPGSTDIGLCIAQDRARGADSSYNCSLIVLNGVPVSGIQALNIDPAAIESIAILGPTEASTFYGTIGGSGAVLVWTRRGR